MQSDAARVSNKTMVFEEAQKHEPPTWMVLRQVEIESGYDNTLRSSTGCLGVCQILPAAAHDPGYDIEPCSSILDVRLATAFLCRFLIVARRLKGSWGKALLAYNVGMHGNPATASAAYRALAAYVDR